MRGTLGNIYLERSSGRYANGCIVGSVAPEFLTARARIHDEIPVQFPFRHCSSLDNLTTLWKELLPIESTVNIFTLPILFILFLRFLRLESSQVFPTSKLLSTQHTYSASLRISSLTYSATISRLIKPFSVAQIFSVWVVAITKTAAHLFSPSPRPVTRSTSYSRHNTTFDERFQYIVCISSHFIRRSSDEGFPARSTHHGIILGRVRSTSQVQSAFPTIQEAPTQEDWVTGLGARASRRD